MNYITLLCLCLVSFSLAQADKPPPLGKFVFIDEKTGITETRYWGGEGWTAEFHDSTGKLLYTVGGPWKLEGVANISYQGRTSGIALMELDQKVKDQERVAIYVEKTTRSSSDDLKLSHMGEVRRFRVSNTVVGVRVVTGSTVNVKTGEQQPTYGIKNKITATMLCPIDGVTGRNYKLAEKP